ncbi:MAG: hypothetical protein V4801_37555 [Burkholderia gladioli]
MLHSVAAHADEGALCHQGEDVYFGCEAGGKYISICAAGNSSPDRGYVQYRFGSPNKIELKYPKRRTPPGRMFELSHIYGGNLNFLHIKFKSGHFNYVVYRGFPSGVYVLKDGRLISNIACERGVSGGVNKHIFRGLITVPPVREIDG